MLFNVLLLLFASLKTTNEKWRKQNLKDRSIVFIKDKSKESHKHNPKEHNALPNDIQLKISV